MPSFDEVEMAQALNPVLFAEPPLSERTCYSAWKAAQKATRALTPPQHEPLQIPKSAQEKFEKDQKKVELQQKLQKLLKRGVLPEDARIVLAEPYERQAAVEMERYNQSKDKQQKEEVRYLRQLRELEASEKAAEEKYKIAQSQRVINVRMREISAELALMGTHLNGNLFLSTLQQVKNMHSTLQELQIELYSKGQRQMREKKEMERKQKLKQEKKMKRQIHSGMSQEKVVEEMKKILCMMASPDGALLSSDQMCAIYNKYFQESMGQGDFRSALQAVAGVKRPLEASEAPDPKRWTLKGDRTPFSADVLKVALQLHKGPNPSFSQQELVEIHKHLLSNSGMSGEDFGTLCVEPMFTMIGTKYILNVRKQKPKQKKPTQKKRTQESASSSDSSSSGSDSGSDSAAPMKKLPVKKLPVKKQGVKRPLEASEAPDPKKAC